MSNPNPAAAHVPARPQVALIFGGRSSEHQISCLTAAEVLRAIDPARYDVVTLGIAADGRWVQADPSALVAAGGLPSVDAAGHPVALPLATGDRAIRMTEPGQVPQVLAQVDVVFPLLHGPFGEDGTIQGLLELGDLPYVGSGVLASAASMDKHVMKVLLAGHGIAVGPYEVFTARQWRQDSAAALSRVKGLGLPVFVKPARAGSSIGITRVTDEVDLAAAIELAQTHDPKVIVEAEIRGRELECGVLESVDGSAQASELGEIEVATKSGFYDFDAKYLATEDVRLSTPAKVTAQVKAQVQALAVRTFEAMGCEGLARVDVFLTDDGEVLVNELNTMPGFTEHSMYPRMWAASGLEYPALVDRLLQLALRRSTGLR